MTRPQTIEDLIQHIFGEGGVLAEKIKGYVPRPGQIEMAEVVARGLSERKHIVAEAPTGTGKSFAAGIPAALYAATEGITVVYVTANIALQEQLDKKDMPFIAELVNEMAQGEDGDRPPVFRTGIIKGMSNYLCLMELEAAKKERTLPEPWDFVIPDWADKTKFGDKSELSDEPPYEIWSKVSTTSDDCLRKRCAKFKECFVFKNRKRLETAHLIVTNYHLLFIDRMMSQDSEGMASLLPDYDFLILDEAHEAPEIAMDFRGYKIGPGRWARMGKFLNRAAVGGDNEAAALREALEKRTQQLTRQYASLGREGSVLEFPIGNDAGLVELLDATVKYASGKRREFEKRIEAGGGDENEKVLAGHLEATIKATMRAQTDLALASFGVHTVREKDFAGKETEYEVVGSAKKLGSFPKNHVYFFETSSKGTTSLACKVLDTQAFFRRYILDPKVAVFMSATLSAKGSLSFMTNAIGLVEGEFEEVIVGSPFKGENVLVVVPSRGSFPDPDAVGFQPAVADAISTVFDGMPSGGMMCLFTSYANLRYVAQRVANDPVFKGVPTFVQGEAGKMQIIRGFMKAYEEGQKALVLATGSFWQGVDIPGQALSVVVIDKIPFTPPDDPVMWHMERTSRTAFTRYAVPKAVIALKQGVGRLIRRVDDYGAVVVLDPRTRDPSKAYFKAIDSAFPAGCLVSEDLEDVATFLQEKEDERSTKNV